MDPSGGGSAGAAPTTTRGGAPGAAGARPSGGQSGADAGGGGAGEGSRAGTSGTAPVESGCNRFGVAVVSHVPANGAVAVDPAALVGVTFNCSYDRIDAQNGGARLYGDFSGAIDRGFPSSPSTRQLWLDPQPRPPRFEPYFPGERLTVLLHQSLAPAGSSFVPYLWQFNAAVSQSSPGKFRAGSHDLSALSKAHAIALGDLDADGALDAVVRDEQTLLVLRNRGDATFDAPQALPGYGTPVIGDVDGDGDLDVATGDLVMLNDGQGHFEPGPEAKGCVALADVDGDADLDCLAVFGYGDSQMLLGHVLFNTGSGTFEAGTVTPFGFECDVVDLDADGDLDAVCISPVLEAARVFINDGRGGFTRSEQVLGDVGARGIALGDLDADADIDVVVSHWFGAGKFAPNRVYLNDGQGHFELGGSLGSDGGSIALGDIDGDGDLDALFSELTPYGPSSGPFNPISIHENDGAARFKASQQTLGDPAFHWFKLGDLDGDGDLDAFVFHQVGGDASYSSVWLNEKD